MLPSNESAPQPEPKPARKRVRIRPEFEKNFEYVRVVKEETLFYQATETSVEEQELSKTVITRININNLIQMVILIIAIVNVAITLMIL